MHSCRRDSPLHVPRVANSQPVPSTILDKSRSNRDVHDSETTVCNNLRSITTLVPHEPRVHSGSQKGVQVFNEACNRTEPPCSRGRCCPAQKRMTYKSDTLELLGARCQKQASYLPFSQLATWLHYNITWLRTQFPQQSWGITMPHSGPECV
jgi:hypothetical protein